MLNKIRKKGFLALTIIVLIALFAAGCDTGLTGSDTSAEDAASLSKRADKPLPVPVEPEPVVLPEGDVISIDGPDSFPLIAGKKKPVGQVVVSVVGTDLLVTYETTAGYGLSETHLWVGTSLDGIPDTRKGNPKVGRFPYKSEGLGGVNTYTVTIPLSTLTAAADLDGMVFYAAAHAEVVMEGKGGKHSYKHTESAWAGTERLVPERGNWATYFSFAVAVTAAPPPPPADAADAYAVGDLTFIEAGYTATEWGWRITLMAEGSGSVPLYAEAVGNDLGAGTYVGNLQYSYAGGVLTASFEMFAGYTLLETQLYASDTEPFSIFATPEAYGQITHPDLNNASTDSFSVGGLDFTPIYVVAYASVAGVD